MSYPSFFFFFFRSLIQFSLFLCMVLGSILIFLLHVAVSFSTTPSILLLSIRLRELHESP